jgi:hypothetical protein
MKLTELTVDAYLLYENPLRGTHITLQRMPSEDAVRWAICKGSHACLCKGRVAWILQSLPSHCDVNFFNTCRWPTAQEALDYWETVKEKAIRKAEPKLRG